MSKSYSDHSDDFAKDIDIDNNNDGDNESQKYCLSEKNNYGTVCVLIIILLTVDSSDNSR
jgi:hypothetical protein